MPRRLTDRVCVIAGAASEVGAAVCGRLQAEGARVAALDRRDHTVGDLPLV
jgi:NAD(P)-dependent dehydrogenase (short-subunit alcohol dehydrogenase family)